MIYKGKVYVNNILQKNSKIKVYSTTQLTTGYIQLENESEYYFMYLPYIKIDEEKNTIILTKKWKAVLSRSDILKIQKIKQNAIIKGPIYAAMKKLKYSPVPDSIKAKCRN